MLYRINFIFKLSLAGTGQISVSGTRECFDFLESLLSVAIFLSAERQGQSKRKWKSKKSVAKIRPDGRQSRSQSPRCFVNLNGQRGPDPCR